jgi:plasmid stabilization system protein ParE
VLKVIVSPRAWDDFFQIFEYIAQDSPGAAARFCDGILDHIDTLATFPHLGAPAAKRPGLRSVLHTPIRIYYRVDEDRQCIEIVHFWHTSRRDADY